MRYINLQLILTFTLVSCQAELVTSSAAHKTNSAWQWCSLQGCKCLELILWCIAIMPFSNVLVSQLFLSFKWM